MTPDRALTQDQLELAAPVSLWRYLHLLLSGVDTACCCEHQFLEHFWQGFTWGDIKVQNSFRGNNVFSKLKLNRSWSCFFIRDFVCFLNLYPGWELKGLIRFRPLWGIGQSRKRKSWQICSKTGFLLIFQLFCRFNKLKYLCKYFEAFSSLITFGTLSFLTVLQRKTHYYGFCGRSSNLST